MTGSPGVSAVDDRPTILASYLAVLLAAGSLLLVFDGLEQVHSLVRVTVGVLLLVEGGRQWRTRELVGWGLTLIGGAVVVAGFELAIRAPLSSLEMAELGPGLLGVAVLGLALRPLARDVTVTLATAGAGLVLHAVLMTGIAHSAGRLQLLVATAGTVAAWDAARHAITLGRQVGRGSGTRTVELLHVGATMGVGGLFAGLAAGIWRLGVTDLPLSGLLVFLGAAFALLVALYGRPVRERAHPAEE